MYRKSGYFDPHTLTPVQITKYGPGAVLADVLWIYSSLILLLENAEFILLI